MRVWRLVRRPYADLSGIGAASYPGRWNAARQRVVYTAEHPALAVLEVRVHLGLDLDLIPPDYVLMAIELGRSPGKQLVHVALVAHVPEDLVLRGVQQRVQRNGQLAGAEVGAEVPTDLSDGVDDVSTHLVRDLLELLIGQAMEVLGLFDLGEEV